MSRLDERAEDAFAAITVPASGAALRTERYAALHLPNPSPIFGRVDRIRLDSNGVGEAIEEIRRWFASVGRERFSWWVGRHARPGDLHERLLAAGAEPSDDPETAVMVLDGDPPPAPSVEVRPVVSLGDFDAQREIRFEAFHFFEHERAAARARTDAAFAEYVESDLTQFLALLDGVPVAAAGVAVTSDRIAVLVGGATLEQARGRGAYRALVRARCEEARRRGADAVVVHAGRMSRPILERLGFTTVSNLRVLVDDSATPGTNRRP